MARANLSQRWPTNPRELGQTMADPQRFAEMFPNAESGAWDDFAHAYAASSPQIAAKVAQAEQLAIGDFMRKHPVNGNGRGPVGALDGAAPGRSRFYDKRAPGATLDHLFAGVPDDERLGAFVQAAIGAATGRISAEGVSRQLLEAQDGIRNAMSERVPGSGGFLVPENLRSDMLVALLEHAIVRGRARMVPMDSLRIPYPAIDSTTDVSSVFGGVTATWSEEGAALPVSQPSFARVVLEAKKLVTYTTIPNELLEDAPTLTQFLGDIAPAAIGFFEDVAFLTGTGTGQPQGVINAPGAVQVTRTTASKVAFADIVNMYARLLPRSFESPSTCWVCSPDVLPQLMQMAVIDTKNATTIAPGVWLSGMQGISDRPGTLLGFPVCVSEKMPALGTTGDLILVDWAYYLLGERHSLEFAMSEEYLFANDLSAFRWIERVDGRLWLQSPITQQSGSANTLSAAILLH